MKIEEEVREEEQEEEEKGEKVVEGRRGQKMWLHTRPSL